MKKMQTSTCSLFGVILALFCIIGCASTSKATRSLQTTSSKIQSIKTAEEVATNYGMGVLCDTRKPENKTTTISLSDFYTTEIFVAADESRDEVVVFTTLKAGDGKKITFSYLSIAGERSSTIEYHIDIGRFYLHNDESLCELDASGYYLATDLYESWTQALGNIRQRLENDFNTLFSITFAEQINEQQRAVIAKKKK